MQRWWEQHHPRLCFLIPLLRHGWLAVLLPVCFQEAERERAAATRKAEAEAKQRAKESVSTERAATSNYPPSERASELFRKALSCARIQSRARQGGHPNAQFMLLQFMLLLCCGSARPGSLCPMFKRGVGWRRCIEGICRCERRVWRELSLPALLCNCRLWSTVVLPRPPPAATVRIPSRSESPITTAYVTEPPPPALWHLRPPLAGLVRRSQAHFFVVLFLRRRRLRTGRTTVLAKVRRGPWRCAGRPPDPREREEAFGCGFRGSFGDLLLFEVERKDGVWRTTVVFHATRM